MGNRLWGEGEREVKVEAERPSSPFYRCRNKWTLTKGQQSGLKPTQLLSSRARLAGWLGLESQAATPTASPAAHSSWSLNVHL